MKYRDYRAVYIDKAVTFEQWQGKNAERLITGSSAKTQNKGILTPLQQKIKAAEDKAFVAATGKDFGFKKLNREPDWAAEISYVNGDGKGLERMMNCQRCALALEARMRGYDVIARPSYGATDEMRTVAEWLKVFNYSPSEIKKCTGKTEIAAAYKLKMADFDSIGILRVDNLEFTEWIKRCGKNRGEGDGNT